MKKYVIIPLGICLFLIILSGFYLYRKYLVQVDAQKEMMVAYVCDTKTKIDMINARFRELPYIVMPVVGEIGMTEKDVFIQYAENISQLEQFYTSISHYTKGIFIYDIFGDVCDLFYDKKNDSFIKSTYKPRSINTLRSIPVWLVDKNSYSMILPVYHGNTLAGNVVVDIDVVSLHRELFKPYLEKKDVWPTSILDEETLLTLPVEGEWTLSHEYDIMQEIQKRKSGFFSGWIKGAESSARIVTYYESLNASDYYLGLAFSSNISPLIASYLWTFAIIFVILAALTSVIPYAFNRMIVQYMTIIKKKEQEIQFLQNIYRSTPVGIIVRKNNSFFSANDCLFALLDEYISYDDVGKDMKELKLPASFYRQSENDEDHQESDLYAYEKSGREICLRRRQMSMYMDGIKYGIDTYWDITELKQHARSEITKSELLIRISADVKQTLDNIMDAVALLVQRYPDDVNLGFINRLTAELSGLIDQVKDYADIEAGRVALNDIPFNLIDEIKKTKDLFQVEAQRKGIELRAHVASSVIRNVVGDAQRFRQIMSELLDNAIKFTSEGTVRLSIETTELQNRKILIKCSVEDTGQGMSRKEIKNMFSPDLRMKEGKSIGLSIIIVRKLVNIMGGSLRVASPSPISTNPSTPGTQFLFSIICYSDQPFDKKLDYSSIVSYSQINILIIASDPSQVQYLTDFLKCKGIKVDIFIYNKDSSDLLINKLIIDKDRYQIVVIAAETGDISFAIAEEIHQYHLTDDSLYLLTETCHYSGNYIKAKALNMDYYSAKSDDLSMYDLIFRDHFPNISDKALLITDKVQQSLQILIVENNMLSGEINKVIFRKLGFEVDLAQNALTLVSQLNRTTYDIIFIDLKLPPADGFEIVEVLRMKGFKMPIIAMTSTLTKVNLKQITDSGMDGYIPKPLNPDSVKNIMLKWFG